MAADRSRHGSQNVLFVGEVDGDDPEWAPGLAIVQKLEEALRNHGWVIAAPFENRDGELYDMIVKSDSAEMQLVFTGIDKDTWMLQISPARLIGRFRHKVPSATPVDVYNLAQELHEILFVRGDFSDPKWCWDGFPDQMETFPEPPGPEVPAVLVRPHRITWSGLRPRDARERKDCLACLALLAIDAVGLVFLVRAIVRWIWGLLR